MTEEPRQIDRVTHELSCARCGYILRGLAASGACPECGEAIETSLKGNLLRAADPRWLKTVSRGVGPGALETENRRSAGGRGIHALTLE